MHIRERKLLIAIIFVIFVCYILISTVINNRTSDNYRIMHVGNGHIEIPESLYNEANICSYEHDYFFEGNDFMILGMDLSSNPECKTTTIDASILDKMDISEENIYGVENIKSKKELQEVFNVPDEDVLDLNGSDRITLKKYSLTYQDNDLIISVASCKKEQGTMLMIIKAKSGLFTDDQLASMLTTVGY